MRLMFPRSALKGYRLSDRPRSRTATPGGHSHVVFRHQPPQARLRHHHPSPPPRPAQRGPRDLMRARLRLVEKSVSAQHSIDRLLEKFNLTTVAGLEGLYQLQASCHTAQMELLETQITTLEHALHPHLIPNPDVQRLLWIPGVGKVNAFTIYTEIAGIARFPSVRQFFSYSRLVPRADNSWGRVRDRSSPQAADRH